MGREIRRVPPDWEHPRATRENARHPDNVGKYRPLYDCDYKAAAEMWMASFDLFRVGQHANQRFFAESEYYWEDDPPPDWVYYRDRRWTKEEATAIQMYETVSEGTPVSPVFETKEELVDYLVKHGDYGDQHGVDIGWQDSACWSRPAAERFVREEWAPSMIVNSSPDGVDIQTPRQME